MKFVILETLLLLACFTAMAMGDCWWTGCQPNDWAVTGCAQYGRWEKERRPCTEGYFYHCCAYNNDFSCPVEKEQIGSPIEIVNNEEDVLNLCISDINNARRNNGNKPALHYNGNLRNAAQFHSNWMKDHNCFSHQCPNEPGLGDRVSNHGYRWSSIGEIIASGYGNCASAVNDGWMNSQGHKNIILGDYIHVGCGMNSNYWTCVFAKPL